jgi:hypothetical protein
MMKNLSQNIYEKVIKPYNIEQNKNIPPENPSNITAK